MKKIVGAALFGLGVLLLVFGIGLATFVAPTAAQLPYDLERSTSVAVSQNAEFLHIKDGQATIGRSGLMSTVAVIPQAKTTNEKMTGALEGKAVVWDVFSDVRRVDTEEVVSAYSAEFATDRRTGAVADWDDAWLEDGTERQHNFEGQLYKFPFGTQRQDYAIFDRDLRRAVPAQFQAVETIHGVETYRFEQVIPEEQIPVAESSLAVLLSTFAPEADSGKVVYSNSRTYWVEPVTGAFVDQRDQPRKELVASDGQRTVLLRADFRYDEATAAASAKRASDNAGQLALVSLWLPIIGAVLGLVLVGVGLVLYFRIQRRSRHRAGSEPDRPDPTTAEKDGADEATPKQETLNEQPA